MFLKRLAVLIVLFVPLGARSSDQPGGTDTQKTVESAQFEGKTILLDFSAIWCPTCRTQSKVLEKLRAEGFLKDIKVIKIDYDSEKELKKQFRITGQSTLIVLQGLVETKRAQGITEERDIRQFLTDASAPIALKTKLDAIAKSSEAKIPSEIRAVMEAATEELRKSNILKSAPKIGSNAPNFKLKDSTGKPTELKTLLRKSPVILTFYRGSWCPYCNEQLRSYQKHLADFESAGGQLVAITPDLPSNVLTSAEKNAIRFAIISDQNNKVAKTYGLVFGVPPDLKEIYLKFGVNLEKSQGNDDWKLPVPATFVIGQDGKITYSFIDLDYKSRAEPLEIIQALNKIKTKDTRK